MAEYSNKISLWKRKPRENDVAGKSYPHYQGNINIDGVMKDCAVWIQTDKKNPNQPDMSGTVSEPYKKPENNTEEIPY
ncbi:hypothetical protein N8990_05110 [Candidatus Pelagibacter sp.]|nr:hypothetical protein [Candidatus Pelagibacter sp.]